MSDDINIEKLKAEIKNDSKKKIILTTIFLTGFVGFLTMIRLSPHLTEYSEYLYLVRKVLNSSDFHAILITWESLMRSFKDTLLTTWASFCLPFATFISLCSLSPFQDLFFSVFFQDNYLVLFLDFFWFASVQHLEPQHVTDYPSVWQEE